MINVWLGITLGVAIIDWVAVAKQWRVVEYICKPGTMLCLLAWLWSVTGIQGSLIWLALGIIFSLAGDIFLLLPWNLFIQGLISFLLAHLAYITKLNPSFPPFNLPALILVILILFGAWQIYRRLSNGMRAHGHEKLQTPVLIYAIVITLMLLSAAFTLVRPDWLPVEAILVTAGALLFYLSDIILAWNRFITPIPNGRLLNMIAYHLGQIGLVAGVILHSL